MNWLGSNEVEILNFKRSHLSYGVLRSMALGSVVEQTCKGFTYWSLSCEQTFY